jgi:hypothetical protein
VTNTPSATGSQKKALTPLKRARPSEDDDDSPTLRASKSRRSNPPEAPLRKRRKLSSDSSDNVTLHLFPEAKPTTRRSSRTRTSRSKYDSMAMEDARISANEEKERLEKEEKRLKEIERNESIAVDALLFLSQQPELVEEGSQQVEGRKRSPRLLSQKRKMEGDATHETGAKRQKHDLEYELAMALTYLMVPSVAVIENEEEVVDDKICNKTKDCTKHAGHRGFCIGHRVNVKY